jgi:chemotaxis protein methyltransferase CheR
MTVLAALLEARTGQQIAAYRAWRLDTALKPLLREKGFDTLEQLVGRLLGGQDQRIGDQIVDALVNGESSFFRDAHVFDVADQVLAEAQVPGRRLRVWSAGCAAGQEPLSLAMLLAERAERAASPVPEIVATDVSEAALARARRGVFTQFEIQRGLPIRRMMRWFDGEGDSWTARPELLGLVRFRRVNLVADPPPAGQFDLVLCRNVLLYFSAPVKAQVFAMLAGVIRPGGHLMLGAGETVIGQTGLFRPSTRFRGLYERTEAALAERVAA